MICDECKNGNLCKFREGTEETFKRLEPELRPSILSPVSVKIECGRFEKQAQRQDGIWNKGR